MYRIYCIVGLLLLSSVPAWTQEPQPGVVFVVSGAGNFRRLNVTMDRIMENSGLPLALAHHEWASGAIRDDICDADAHQRAGYALAQRILAYRKAYPTVRVHVVSHSAGCAVTLAATQWLPANSIDRFVLLAPVVSTDHDLRQALRVSRHGIDHFWSEHDEIARLCGHLYGSTDGRATYPAGLYGFRPVIASKADAELYGKLRQYPYRADYGEFGNQGGHFGVASKKFLWYAVLPMFAN